MTDWGERWICAEAAQAAERANMPHGQTELEGFGVRAREKAHRIVGPNTRTPGWVALGMLDHIRGCGRCRPALGSDLENQLLAALATLLVEVERLRRLNGQLAQTVNETVPALMDELEVLRPRRDGD